jgi:hypothetical protein
MYIGTYTVKDELIIFSHLASAECRINSLY